MSSSSAQISYVLERLIATGAQGTVYLAARTDLPSNSPEHEKSIAVKKFPLSIDKVQKKRQIRVLEERMSNILALNHANIVRHLATEITLPVNLMEFSTYTLVTEYCAGRTLEDAVKKTWLPPGLLQKWITQILQGLAYLHDDQQRIVHRDIKGESILLTIPDIEKCTLKITGFGDVKKLLMGVTQRREVSHSHGTSRFMSPEMIEAYSGNVNIGRKTDIWSFGCVIVQMVTGKCPTYSRVVDGVRQPLTEDFPVMYFVVKGGNPDLPEGLPEVLESFIRVCLQRNPTDRPNAVQLLKHQLITGNVDEWSYPFRTPKHAGMSSSFAQISYVLKRIIAGRTQGAVFLAARTDLPSNSPEHEKFIVVKKFPLSIDRVQMNKQIGVLEEEMSNILALNHANMVRHLAREIAVPVNLIDFPTYAVIMEYCAGGTLEDAVTRTWLPPSLLQRWITQILQGLAYLHQQRIVHRDIKGENILLTIPDIETCTLKIADLGSIKKLFTGVTQPREVSHSVGTSKCMSPEMIEAYSGNVNIGKKTDIYSLGCVVVQMVTGKCPTYSRVVDGVRQPLTGDFAVMQFVFAGGSPDFPEGLPEVLESFIRVCLQRNPDDRPSAVQLLEHQLITGNADEWSYPVYAASVVAAES